MCVHVYCMQFIWFMIFFNPWVMNETFGAGDALGEETIPLRELLQVSRLTVGHG